jgi:signal transduction histidine kinase
MSSFSQLKKSDGTLVDFEANTAPPPKRPSRWALSNWPVRWKVFAIVLVPLVLAVTFGGLRIYSSWVEATDLRRAADRAEMVPAIVNYMAALDDAMLAAADAGDVQSALGRFDSSRQELQRRLHDTDVADDVSSGITSMARDGQSLMDKVMSNNINLFDRVTAYAPILLTAEDAINGSVRVENERIRAETLGLSRAVGARGQMLMQQLLVTMGAELPEPELRTRMMTLAGTEPSTIFGMNQVLGVGSPQADQLQAEFVKRMGIVSDPAAVLVGNPDLLASIQATDQIAKQIVDRSTKSIAEGVAGQDREERNDVIRDSAIVGGAIVLALLIVALVARSLVRPLRRLRDSALKIAHEDLTREIEQLRAGGEPGPVTPIDVHTSEEMGQVAHAVDELHEQAVMLAGEQARLQLQVGDMFETLSRRSRSLVDQQLSLIDRLERNEEDPDRLESLFRLDHLAARMRRNGANLLVLAGAKVPREQAEPVPVSAIINAAASEVEDYTRVVTATVPDSEVLGSVAGDLVHLLAELLDNALRYSPPISQVRVSAVHTGNGGLVIEVSDIGLGMTESDLRVANTRLQAGGEVNPYTARHMGLFVVSRLAAQHGLVVRLRSTIAGEPNSGMTAGVYVPTELLNGTVRPDQYRDQGYGTAADAHAGIATALALDEDHWGDADEHTDQYVAVEDHPNDVRYDEAEQYDEAEVYDGDRNGHPDVPISVLPQRNPGASGISDIPVSLAMTAQPVEDDEWPEDSMPAQTVEQPRPEPVQTGPAADEWGAPHRPTERPTNTAGFFAARAQVAANGAAHQPADAVEPPAVQQQAPQPPAPQPARTDAALIGHPHHAADDGDDEIYQKMLSEWLVDPSEIARSDDLNWESVWDNGWSAAAAAESTPVVEHTEDGLPKRQPGARLVPGAADPAPAAGQHRNGGAHRSSDDDDEVASAAGQHAGRHGQPAQSGSQHNTAQRDPDAVRASISSHFGGVHAGRLHARETRGTDTP